MSQTYKVTYMKTSGGVYSRMIKADTKSEAGSMIKHHVIMAIYKVNETGAIIG